MQYPQPDTMMKYWGLAKTKIIKAAVSSGTPCTALVMQSWQIQQGPYQPMQEVCTTCVVLPSTQQGSGLPWKRHAHPSSQTKHVCCNASSKCHNAARPQPPQAKQCHCCICSSRCPPTKCTSGSSLPPVLLTTPTSLFYFTSGNTCSPPSAPTRGAFGINDKRKGMLQSIASHSTSTSPPPSPPTLTLQSSKAT